MPFVRGDSGCHACGRMITVEQGTACRPQLDALAAGTLSAVHLLAAWMYQPVRVESADSSHMLHAAVPPGCPPPQQLLLVPLRGGRHGGQAAGQQQ
jgi:hypothetical protein